MAITLPAEHTQQLIVSTADLINQSEIEVMDALSQSPTFLRPWSLSIAATSRSLGPTLMALTFWTSSSMTGSPM
jgi:hypothetical protein